MGLWSIVVPEATTNLVGCPSFETQYIGWSSLATATLQEVSTQQYVGVWSLQITPSSTTNSGVRYAVTLGAGTYTISMMVLGVLGVPYQVGLYDETAAAYLGTPKTFVGTGAWQLVTATATRGANASCSVRITKNGSVSVVAFFVDAVQLEAKAYHTTYCDGEQDGCFWNGTDHLSTSSRDAQSMAGGREIDLADIGLYVEAQLGTGMAALEHIVTSYGNLEGSFYQRTAVKDRVFTLRAVQIGSTLPDLHSKRAQVIDTIKPDRLRRTQPVRVRYRGGSQVMEILALYDDGLGFGGEVQGFSEQVGLRFVSHNPYWRSEKWQGVDLNVQTSIPNTGGIVQRSKDGVWSNMGVQFISSVYAMVRGQDRTLYVGGGFSSPYAYIARYTNFSWSALGSGMNESVYALAVDARGFLYAGGSFTTAGGVTVNRVAVWNGVSWSALGSGFSSGIVHALAIAPDGTLYAGGSFTSPSRIAQWNGSSWVGLGTGCDDVVRSIAIGPDGYVYVGGSFFTANGVSVKGVARWNGSTFQKLGGGLTAVGVQTVNAIAFGADGLMYVTGLFSEAESKVVNNIAVWNGISWRGLSSGLSSASYSLLPLSDGSVYVGGIFSSAGGFVLPDSVALWNGSSWMPIDINFPGTAQIYALATDEQEEALFVGGGNLSGTAIAAAPITIVNNGTATVYPRLLVRGSGRIYQLANWTTKDIISFNLSVQSAEKVVLDLRRDATDREGRIKGRTFRSNWRGNIASTILPGSKDGTFRLLPGANSLSLYIDNTDATAELLWQPRYWSVDGKS